MYIYKYVFIYAAARQIRSSPPSVFFNKSYKKLFEQPLILWDTDPGFAIIT